MSSRLFVGVSCAALNAGEKLTRGAQRPHHAGKRSQRKERRPLPARSVRGDREGRGSWKGKRVPEEVIQRDITAHHSPPNAHPQKLAGIGVCPRQGLPKKSIDGDFTMSYNSTMKAVTIREAKARLNALVKAAERGEQVVLMRGSKHVAVILPVSAEDLELAPGLTDPQAERLWRRLEEERREGTSGLFHRPRQAVTHLDTGSSPQTRRGRRASKKPSANTRGR